jgi:hypothetical protein
MELDIFTDKVIDKNNIVFKKNPRFNPENLNQTNNNNNNAPVAP